MIRFLLFLGILLFLFNQITPYLYRLLPNDYVRTRLIWSTLNNPEERPDLVILGNSLRYEWCERIQVRSRVARKSLCI